MQMVKAKCILAAWDSINCVQYQPGEGPLPGGLYEIDRDGPLAKLRISGRKDAMYVFDFDRNAGPGDKPHDYSCKDCGLKFKTLPALGTHTRSEHGGGAGDNDDDAAGGDIEVAKDMRGKKSGKTFTCKTCGEVLANLYLMGQHNKTHAVIPATAEGAAATA